MLADVYLIIFTPCKTFQVVMKEFQCAALPQVNLVCGLPGVCKTSDRIAKMHLVYQYMQEFLQCVISYNFLCDFQTIFRLTSWISVLWRAKAWIFLRSYPTLVTLPTRTLICWLGKEI